MDGEDARRDMDMYSINFSSRVENANRETSEIFDRDSEADRLEWEQKVRLLDAARDRRTTNKKLEAEARRIRLALRRKEEHDVELGQQLDFDTTRDACVVLEMVSEVCLILDHIFMHCPHLSHVCMRILFHAQCTLPHARWPRSARSCFQLCRRSGGPSGGATRRRSGTDGRLSLLRRGMGSRPN
jgi:hypothetical protein